VGVSDTRASIHLHDPHVTTGLVQRILLRSIMNGDSKEDAEEAAAEFRKEFAPKHQRAVNCLEKDLSVLLTLFDFPAEHWLHLRTTNPVEFAFATVRLRQRVTKGAGSRTKGLAVAFKLLTMAEARWRRLNGSHLLSPGPRRRALRRRDSTGTTRGGSRLIMRSAETPHPQLLTISRGLVGRGSRDFCS